MRYEIGSRRVLFINKSNEDWTLLAVDWFLRYMSRLSLRLSLDLGDKTSNTNFFQYKVS